MALGPVKAVLTKYCDRALLDLRSLRAFSCLLCNKEHL